MKKFTDGLFQIGISIILAVAAAAASVITCLSFLFYIHYTNENDIERHGNLPMVLLSAALILFLLVLFRKISAHISCRILFLVFMAIYAIAGIYLITHCPDPITDDASMIFQYVQSFESGDYSGLGRVSYVTFATHQIGFLAYEQALYHLFGTKTVFFVLNLIYVILINLISWKFTELQTGKESTAAKYAVFLSFLFFPLLFFILFAYGNVPSLLLLYLAFYLTAVQISAERESKVPTLKASHPDHFARPSEEKVLIRNHSAGSRYRSVFRLTLIAVLTGAACLLKPNSMLGAIVIILILCLLFLKKHRVRFLIATAGCIACSSLFSSLVFAHYETVSGHAFRNGGVPKISYIAMGLQEDPDGNSNRDGMYNGFVFDNWFGSGGDVSYCIEEADASISQRLQKFAAEPRYAVSFFAHKLVGTWCEPTFMSTWSGPWIYHGLQVEGSLLQNLYRNGTVFMVYQLFMRGYIFLLYLLFAAGLWKLFHSRKKLPWQDVLTASILPLWFLSGFCYHFIAETKSQYVFQYAFVMIPTAAAMISRLLSSHKSILAAGRRNTACSTLPSTPRTAGRENLR